MVETLPMCLIVTIWEFMIVIEHVLKLQQSHNNKTQTMPGVWCCPLTPVTEKEEASRISELEVSLVYKEFQMSQSYTTSLVSTQAHLYINSLFFFLFSLG